MPNIKAFIAKHNKQILSPERINATRTCNCINKENCPLNQNCLVSNVIYEATIKSDLPNYQEKKYIGLCESTFKKRFARHKTSFNHERHKNDTALSTELWKVKEMKGIPTINWRIVKKARSYTPESRHCSLCLTEKYEIANYPEKNLLNKRSEIIAKCRHRRKYLLMLLNSEDNT